MGSNIYNSCLIPVSNQRTPFTIEDWDGVDGTDDPVPGVDYMVNSGVCLSKYSFNTGSYIPIQKLTSQLSPYEKGAKIFIEFGILGNLQCSGATVKCEKVGKDAPKDGWTTYPDFFKIEPGFEFDDKGRVKKYRDGARQTKAYALVGYATEDTNKNGDEVQSSSSSSSSSSVVPGGNPFQSSSSSSSSITAPTWIQILDTNLILVATIASGIPCAIPFPFYNNTLKHYYACINPTLADTI
jgi:hypothetical protein